MQINIQNPNIINPDNQNQENNAHLLVGADFEGQKLIVFHNYRERLRQRTHRSALRIIFTDEDAKNLNVEKNPKKRD